MVHYNIYNIVRPSFQETLLQPPMLKTLCSGPQICRHLVT